MTSHPTRSPDELPEDNQPDERTGPTIEQDPTPGRHPFDTPDDDDEPGVHRLPSQELEGLQAPPRLTPSGRLMRPTNQEAYY